MNRITRRALMTSRRVSEYYVTKQGFRITEEKPEENSKEKKDDEKK